MDGYVADTSIFVAAERGRELGAAPEGMARISVVTLTELYVGVGTASTAAERDLREATVSRARSFIALPYDEFVAAELAKLVVVSRAAKRRASSGDAIIAATALVHDLVVWTHDDDFDALAEVEPRLRVHHG